jgi:hypothetical protein
VSDVADEGVMVRRGPDRDARDSGQFGVALYMFEPLDTEFGAYFMNYHSRAPIFSGRAPRSIYNGLAASAGASRCGTGLRSAADVAGNSSYFVVP